MDLTDEQIAAMCAGIDRFVSAAKATQVARRMRKKKGRPAESYRCPNCGGWHIGHALPKRRGLRNKMQHAQRGVAADMSPTPQRQERGEWRGNKDVATVPIDRLENAGVISGDQASAARDFEELYRAQVEAPGVRDSCTIWEPRGHDGNGDGPVEARRRYLEAEKALGRVRAARLRWVCVEHHDPRGAEIGLLREALNEAVRFFK